MSSRLGLTTKQSRVLLLTLITVVLLYSYTFTNPTSSLSTYLYTAKEEVLEEKPRTWDERQALLVNGRWVEPASNRSFKQLQDEYGAQQVRPCWVPVPVAEDGWSPGFEGFNTSETDERAVARAEAIWNPVWQPHSQAQTLLKFDALEFLEKSLGSNEGVVMIGDSLTMQMVDSIESHVRNAFPSHPKLVRKGQGENMWGPIDLTLRLYVDLPTNDNLTFGRLWDAVQGREERLQLPFLTHMRSDWLSHPEELNEIVSRKGYAEGYELNEFSSMFDQPWEAIPQWTADRIVNTDVPLKHRPLWLFSTGPHFSETINIQKEHLLPLYIDVLHSTLPKIKELPSNPLVVYRATAPGHERCWAYLTPSVNMTDMEHITAGGFDWDLFTPFNKLWKEAIADINQPEDLVYLDIWPMSLTRPDAHRLWVDMFDCLHWAGALPNIWNELLWTLLKETW